MSHSYCRSGAFSRSRIRITGRAICALSVAALLIGLLPADGRAQTASEAQGLLPAMQPLPRLHADPREPGSFGRLLYVSDPDTPLGEDVQGEAALGGVFPIYRLWGGDGDYGVIAVRAGVFGRFSLAEGFGDFISGDWIFAVPLMVKSGRNWYRVGYYHYSAHTGDGVPTEVRERLNLDELQYQRNALEGAANFGVTRALRLYVGALYSFHGQPQTDRPGLYGGFELQGPRVLGLPSFVASHAATDPKRDWSAELNGQVGLIVGPPGTRRIRMAFEVYHGSSPQRQFFRDVTTYMGLALYYDF